MKKRNVSFKEAMASSPGISQLWGNFIASVNELLTDKPTDAAYALVDCQVLLGHSRIILEWLTTWAKNLLSEKEYIKERLELVRALGESTLEESRAVSRPNNAGIVESEAKKAERIGYLKGMREALQVSPEMLSNVEAQEAYQQTFSRAWEDMHRNHIVPRVAELMRQFNLEEFVELGNQKGPDYWRGKDSDYPSFPARPPLHPTATPRLVGQDSQKTQFCHCISCAEDKNIVTYDTASARTKCEDYTCDKCHRMLTTRIVQPDDKRGFDPWKDRDMTKP